MLTVQVFEFNEFAENTYVLYNQAGECAIIDPGCHHTGERNTLLNFIEQNALTPRLLLNTHCHIDHVLGNNFVSESYQLPLHLHPDELFTYKDANKWAAMFGLPNIEIPQQQKFLVPGTSLMLGSEKIDILFTPGHSIASVSFYHAASASLFSGDVLFYQSIGRTDLPGGNMNTLLQSIKTQLWPLPPHTVVYPGHGPATRIGFEKENNPFFH